MSKGLSYNYIGTKGHVIAVASTLPNTKSKLEKQGWKNVSHPKQAATGAYTYIEPMTGLKIRFDEAKKGQKGFAAKAHYHILNPNATSNRDIYLDKYGNPVAKNSRASHILPKEE